MFARSASIAAFVLVSLSLSAQVPESAHVNLYFPQFADGGNSQQQWQTIFTFVNPNQVGVGCALTTFGDDGRALNLDLGTGIASRFSVSIPAGGTRTLRSRIASQVTVTGWAFAACSAPVQAIVAFRQLLNGTSRQEITAQSTLPTLDYISPATPALGVAIANPYSAGTVTVDVGLRDAEGRAVGTPATITLTASAHTTFNVFQRFPNLPSNFQGVLVISARNRPIDQFVAWTLNSDSSGTLSTLPPGNRAWPISHWDRIWLVYRQVTATTEGLGFVSPLPELRIRTEPIINARAIGGTTVEIHTALSQLISDSPSELAFVVGHELGHIIQQRSGVLANHSNPEFDADIWGTMLALASGYDPYAAAGALSKLAMASGRSGLISQFEDQLSGEAHASFNTRLSTVFETLQSACNMSATMKQFCQGYKSIVHPDLPGTAPLYAHRAID